MCRQERRHVHHPQGWPRKDEHEHGHEKNIEVLLHMQGREDRVLTP